MKTLGLAAAMFPAEWSAKLDMIGIGTLTLWAFCFGAFSGLIGAVIGNFRNRPAMGLFLGMVIPAPFGWIFALFVKRGDGGEGIGSAVSAFLAAGLILWAQTFVLWKAFVRPTIDKVQTQMAEVEARNARAEEAERSRYAARAEQEEAERMITWGERSSDLTWDPVPRAEVGRVSSYRLRVVHHFTAGELLLQSHEGGEYVLIEHPNPFAERNGTLIRFHAAVVGQTAFRATDGSTRRALRLVYADDERRAVNWMFDPRRKTALDR